MPGVSKTKQLTAAVLFAAAFLIARPGFGAATAKDSQPSQTQRVIREAEGLSLGKERAAACAVLWRNIRKAGKDDARILKEKLMQLSRYFYTDKGFQDYLAGKEFFDKGKYPDALEKLLEAQDLEADNVDVLHVLALTQLQLKKYDQAELVNKKALQLCPIDIELLRDQLAIQAESEKWKNALETSNTLLKDYSDNSAITLELTGIALVKTEQNGEALKTLEQAQQKEPKLPEIYYWLSVLKEKEPDSEVKLLTKYVDLCKNKPQPRFDRETFTCSHLADAQKKVKP